VTTLLGIAAELNRHGIPTATGAGNGAVRGSAGCSRGYDDKQGSGARGLGDVIDKRPLNILPDLL
jgi:hypothetical protein